jgi:diacylglycerol O-acyltransferase
MATIHRAQRRAANRLSGEDLTFWWGELPMQPTTMAMLLLLDRVPDAVRLRQAFERVAAAVPRLTERIIDAPLNLTLPHWEADPTFDLDYHVRYHALPGRADLAELFHELGPAYEVPFDRSRPLWEARVYDGLTERGEAALFFKLHHAVADGVGGNAIFAALTDSERAASAAPSPGYSHDGNGAWPEPRGFGARLLDAVKDRVQLDFERTSAVVNAAIDAVEHPHKIARALEALGSFAEIARFRHPPLKHFGRARRLSGMEVPFADIWRMKQALGGSMIDVILTIMARAIGKWHTAHRSPARELMTLVPVNLRTPEEWAERPHVGNVAAGILVPLPIKMRGPLATYKEIHRRIQAKKSDPATQASPILAEILSVMPQWVLTWMTEAGFGTVDFIVTNVPGIMVPRYLAGVEIVAAYPFAPVAFRSPVSIALYGHRERLFIGITSDKTAMPDADRFEAMVRTAFVELREAVQSASRD